MDNPFDIDFSEKSDAQLDALIENWIRKGFEQEAQKPLLEKVKRGTATRKQIKLLTWNQERADLELQPFIDVSTSVPGNQKTTHSTGGKRISGQYWVDRYTGIKNDYVHAYFACHIEERGSEAIFEFRDIREDTTIRFTHDDLGKALELWRALGKKAGADIPTESTL